MNRKPYAEWTTLTEAERLGVKHRPIRTESELVISGNIPDSGAERRPYNTVRELLGGMYVGTEQTPNVRFPFVVRFDGSITERLPNLPVGVLYGIDGNDPRMDTEHPCSDVVWDDRRGVWNRLGAKRTPNAVASRWVEGRLGKVRVRLNPRTGAVQVIEPTERNPSRMADPRNVGGDRSIPLRTNSMPEPIPYNHPYMDVWEKFVIRTNDELRSFMCDTSNAGTVWATAYRTAMKYLYGKRLGRSIDGRYNGDAEQLANDAVSTLYEGPFTEQQRKPSVRTLKRGVKLRKLRSGSVRPTHALQTTNGQWVVPNMIRTEDGSYVLPSFAEQHPNGVPIGAIVRITVGRVIREKARWYEDPNKDQPIQSEPYQIPDAAVRNLVRLSSGDFLTDTELDVLNLLGRGLSVVQIARSLNKPPTTIYSMLDRNRTKYRDLLGA